MKFTKELSLSVRTIESESTIISLANDLVIPHNEQATCQADDQTAVVAITFHYLHLA